MELSKIIIVLHKYLEGESSKEEETILRNYFLSAHVDETLTEYKVIFSYYEKAKEIKNCQNAPLFSNSSSKRKTKNWIAIAASVAVLLGTGCYVFLKYNNTSNENLGTYDDPELAFKETQKALAMLSNHVNKGVEGMQYMQEFEKTKNKIFNPLMLNE